MTDELVFTVAASEAKVLERVTLTQVGLKERQHLQEWVRKNPQMLGDGVKIVTFEFGRWVNGKNQDEHDRLDLLAIDRNGTLIVVELKRGQAPEPTDMQAVKYAAMASRFTLKTLAAYHARYLTLDRSCKVTPEEAEAELISHIGEAVNNDFATFGFPVRIILIASDFAATTTATAVFLAQKGLEFTLLRFQAWKTPNGEFILTLSLLYPIADVEQLRISPKALEERQREAARKRQASIVSRLVQNGTLVDGTPLHLGGAQLSEMSDFIAKYPDRALASWQNDSNPLVWSSNQASYTPTGLLNAIRSQAGLPTVALQGPAFWFNEAGQSLIEIAEEAGI